MTVVWNNVWKEGCLIPLCRMRKIDTTECCEKMNNGQTDCTVLSAFMTFSNNIQARTRNDWKKSVLKQMATHSKPQTFLSEILRPLLFGRVGFILIKEVEDFFCVKREKTKKMQQSDVYYQLLSQHVSGIIMPIFRRTKTVLLHLVCCSGSAGCGW